MRRTGLKIADTKKQLRTVHDQARQILCSAMSMFKNIGQGEYHLQQDQTIFRLYIKALFKGPHLEGRVSRLDLSPRLCGAHVRKGWFVTVLLKEPL